MNRREFLKLFGITIATFSFFDLLPKIIKGKLLVRPPGSLVEDMFNAICVRCGRCTQVCPTAAISMAGLGDGFKELGTPKIDGLNGSCERIQGRCEPQAKCAEACPTGAIRAVRRENVKLGSTVLNTGKCIAWQGGACLTCYEVCPVLGAVAVIDESRPMFNENICVGCGRCVYACPAQPKALTLTSKGERRTSPT